MMQGVMMPPQDLRINGGAECRKAIGHLNAALEYYAWLNYHGANESDKEFEKEMRKLIDTFVEELEDMIG